MGRSESIRIVDAQKLLSLVGQLGDYQPLLPEWTHVLMQGISEVVPAQLIFVPVIDNFRHRRPLKTLDVAASGWLDESARTDFYAWMSRPDMVSTHPVLESLVQSDAQQFACRRVEVIDDQSWYRSEIVNTIFRVSRVDDTLCASHRFENTDITFGVGLYRAQGDRPFSLRDRVMLELLLQAIGPMYERAWRRVNGIHPLSPRLREVLQRLLLGDSEKQIAYRLGISQHTVHDYIKALHRHFNVASRAELIITCLNQPVPARTGRKRRLAQRSSLTWPMPAQRSGERVAAR